MNFIDCSASTTLADSPFVISQEEANQTFASSTEGGVAEPLSDSSNKIFFIDSNVYSKSKLWSKRNETKPKMKMLAAIKSIANCIAMIHQIIFHSNKSFHSYLI